MATKRLYCNALMLGLLLLGAGGVKPDNEFILSWKENKGFLALCNGVHRSLEQDLYREAIKNSQQWLCPDTYKGYTTWLRYRSVIDYGALPSLISVMGLDSRYRQAQCSDDKGDYIYGHSVPDRLIQRRNVIVAAAMQPLCEEAYNVTLPREIRGSLQRYLNVLARDFRFNLNDVGCSKGNKRAAQHELSVVGRKKKTADANSLENDSMILRNFYLMRTNGTNTKPFNGLSV